MHRIAIIRGDGIGPEVCEATQRILEGSGARLQWEEAPMGAAARASMGAELPIDSLERVRRLGVALKGPMLAERCSGGVVVDDGTTVRRHPSVNNGLRRELGAFANLRPVQGWVGVSGPYQDLNVVIVREITEDMYSGLERQVEDGAAEAVKRITRAASVRVAEFACEYALRAGRSRVSAIHKANVLHLTDGLFLESVRATVARYPALSFDDKMVDATCYLLIKNPALFDVMVMPNQYGDILSDMVAGLAGSLGLAPGANIGDGVAVFEAAHGAAPDIAGQGIANPIGLALSGALMLDHLEENAAAGRVRTAIAALLGEGRCLTPDLGGRASTAELTASVCARMQDA